MTYLKVPDNLSHFSRHDLAYFEARSSIFLYMSHVSMKLRVLQRFCKNSDSFLSIAQNWFVRAAHDKIFFGFLVSGRHERLYRVSILGVIPQLGSRSKSRSAKFLSLTLTLRGHPGVWQHYRATWTILTIKVYDISQSQPLTHGPVG